MPHLTRQHSHKPGARATRRPFDPNNITICFSRGTSWWKWELHYSEVPPESCNRRFGEAISSCVQRKNCAKRLHLRTHFWKCGPAGWWLCFSFSSLLMPVQRWGSDLGPVPEPGLYKHLIYIIWNPIFSETRLVFAPKDQNWPQIIVCVRAGMLLAGQQNMRDRKRQNIPNMEQLVVHKTHRIAQI